LLGQEVQIGAAIPVIEKGLQAPVAPLRHVMRDTGNHDAGETGHGGRLARGYGSCREISILSLELVCLNRFIVAPIARQVFEPDQTARSEHRDEIVPDLTPPRRRLSFVYPDKI